MSSFKVEVVLIGKTWKHENADTLTCTSVFDFPVLFRTGDFKEGDLAAYVPVDAVVPFTPEFEFIHGGADDIKHRRVKAKRLRGIFSMGFLHFLPYNILWKEGNDVADYFCITKYEPPPPKSYGKGGNLGGGQNAPQVPGFPKYTDIENIRRYGDNLHDGEMVVATEKVHGANFRCGWLNEEFHVGSHGVFRRDPAEGYPCRDCKGTGFWMTVGTKCSHEANLEWFGVYSDSCTTCNKTGRIKDFHDQGNEKNIWWRTVDQYNLKEKLSLFPGHLLFGEVYGDVQDLRYGCKKGEIKFVAFDIFREGKYMDFYPMTAFLEDLEIPMAPIIYEGSYDKENIKALSSGKTTMGDTHIREGLVVRPVQERDVYGFGRCILKVINPDYLLRSGGSEGK